MLTCLFDTKFNIVFFGTKLNIVIFGTKFYIVFFGLHAEKVRCLTPNLYIDNPVEI